MGNRTYGNLYLTRAYLCGPMDRVPDGGIGWRRTLTPWLNSRGIVVLDPTDKPCNIGIETPESRHYRQKERKKGNLIPTLADKAVRQIDLRMVDVTDFTIVYLNMDVHMCGTYEELMWANREKKPVLVMCEQGKHGAPDWLYWTLPPDHIFGSWNDLKNYIDYVNDEDERDIDKLKRWVFFDLRKVTKAAEEAYNRKN